MTAPPPPISLKFYLGNTVEVAKQLIGMLLVRIIDGVTFVSRIVETEAYRKDDPASHSASGPTDRCRIMFETGGALYVYQIYGIHFCMNVVTEAKGVGCAVLIRGIEPLDGFPLLWSRRFPNEPFPQEDDRSARRRIADLTNGPGKLCAALGITKSLNGHELNREPLWVSPRPEEEAPRILSSRRIGISRGVERNWRFYEAGNRFASRSRNRA